MSSCPNRNGRCFPDWASSPATGAWRRPRPSAAATGSSRARSWTCSATWSISPWWWLSHRRQAAGQVRYRLLETLREYALERLTTERSIAAVARRHARYFLDLVERTDARLWAGDEASALTEIERSTITFALPCGISCASGEAEYAARMAGALGMFWFFRGHCSEGRAWLREVLGQVARRRAIGGASAAYAKALHADGRLAHVQGDYAAAQQRLQAALADLAAAGRRRTACQCPVPARAHRDWCEVERAAARPLFLESLAYAERAGDRGWSPDPALARASRLRRWR